MRWNDPQRRLLWEAGFRSAFDGLTVSFLVAFVLALGASNTVVGILAAFPALATISAEFFGGYLSTRFSRRSISIALSIPAYSTWILLALVPLLGSHSIPIIIGGYFVITFLTQLSIPAWTSWISDHVPMNVRGRFFARRNQVTNFIATLSLLIGGWYLDLFPKTSLVGFSTLFMMGTVLGYASIKTFAKIPDQGVPSHTFSIRDFWTMDERLKRFTLFAIGFYSAVQLASPFFSVYLLKTLELSYTVFVIANGVQLFTKVVTCTFWGRIADRYGDRIVMVVSSLGIALVPVAYLQMSSSSIVSIILISAYTGWIWAGADLALFNLLLDCTTPENRAMKTALYSTIIAIPQAVTPLLGGWLADHLSIGSWGGIPLIFGAASIVRALAVLPLLGLHEPRAKKEVSLRAIAVEIVRHPYVAGVNGLRVLGFARQLHHYKSVIHKISFAKAVKLK